MERWCYLSTTSLVADGTTGITPVQATNTMADGRVFASYKYEGRITTSGVTQEVQPTEFDLTDGAGNGVLIATDQVFFEGSTDNAGSATNSWAKILYRVYNASVLEYVGIVQSQQ